VTPDELASLAGAMRPRLHRYCARMMGSAFDGEDVVQDALAKAAQAIGSDGAIVQPEAWLLRIAHNAALDALRRRRRQAARDVLIEPAGESDASDRRLAVEAGLESFLHLPPGPRASVALVDVLGHSAAETAAILAMSEGAVKAALHRGRAALRRLSQAGDAVPPIEAGERARLQAYADRFNAHDWDALRALLAEDVRLDLVNRIQLAGARDVGVYFTRYDQSADSVLSVAVAEGRPTLLVHPADNPKGAVKYVILLDWRAGKIAAIRDFRHAPYIMKDLAII
jgi:RNA polymerase sigma-70 factor (ECF subfamily)